MYISSQELRLRRHRQNLRQAQTNLQVARSQGFHQRLVEAYEQLVLNELSRTWNAQEQVYHFRRRREARIDELLTA